MGARMMSGQTKYHEELERRLAKFVGEERMRSCSTSAIRG